MKDYLFIHSLMAVGALLLLMVHESSGTSRVESNASVTKLPAARTQGGASLERTLAERRSVRDFRNEALSLADVSQILWAAQGITSPRGFRTAPSAGALYPLEVYLVAGRVEGLEEGVYRYRPSGHELLKVFQGDRRTNLAAAALNQSWVGEAPASVVIGAVFERTTGKYRERGVRYVFMEAGHAAQNVCLQAVACGLGSVVVGAFQDREVKQLLRMSISEEPLAIIPFGRTR